MRYRIGYRTIKTAVGTSISIMIAQMLQLDNFVSAGILTILCIKVTKKKSLRASWDRFFACLLAMAFSSLFFEGIAYHPLVIGLLLLFFIPAAVMAKASDGIVTSSVIILHIYSAGEVSKELLLNELGIIIVGIGVALIANLYMPSLESKLKEYRQEIEENFKIIFDEIVSYLRTHESSWDGREITETMELIDEAKALAFRDVENHFRRDENLYYHYFKMREKQFEIIERVLPSVTSIALPVEQGEMIADFIEELSEHIHPGNTAIQFLEKLYRMRVSFENMELPKTREEFEARAALLHFVKEMEQYLIIKSSFRGIKDKVMNQNGTSEAN
ncbi:MULTISPECIES: aromatic acid exporter family protein [unclassified Cytobacillus]|uniref:aromatic acid exporter family protein n=1 Tax=unclassified Cytobacillus TaxID=2675268 RepID=UPI00135BCC6A|nr:aromatic acid exporter family protein [Cytobacillus sp. AMY 15.2]KAF0818477.1 putative membrane protein YqjA [Bacillus sp. ZZV12-4809]MCM3091553.1 aromatic acid exporter family protein [Cytobacillus sp. AMY 15.2]